MSSVSQNSSKLPGKVLMQKSIKQGGGETKLEHHNNKRETYFCLHVNKLNDIQLEGVLSLSDTDLPTNCLWISSGIRERQTERCSCFDLTLPNLISCTTSCSPLLWAVLLPKLFFAEKKDSSGHWMQFMMKNLFRKHSIGIPNDQRPTLNQCRTFLNDISCSFYYYLWS